MTSPASRTLEQPATSAADDVVARLEATFQLPSFVPGSDRDPGTFIGDTPSPRPTTVSELFALALFACLTIASIALVVVSIVD